LNTVPTFEWQGARLAGAVDLLPCNSDLPWLRQVSSGFCQPNIPISSSTIGFIQKSSGASQLSIAADSELHNRGELLDRLSASNLSSSCSDAELILSAFERWGEGCPEFLLGEFSFAIWDDHLKRLFCCRDHFATRPFFYWTNQSRFAFAGDLRALLSLPGIPSELNRGKLAAMTSPGGEHNHHEETFHKSILSLPSATSLTVDRLGLRKRTYWTPDVLPRLVPKKEEDVFDALRELLFEAVDCRIRTRKKVSIYLSGGLDSSALTAVAARCLEKRNRSLLAIAAVLPDEQKSRFADEREFIGEFGSWPNVRTQYVAPVLGGPFDLIEEPSNFVVRFTESPFQYLVNALEDEAVEQGADVIITGHGGEAGATTWGDGYYLELAANLHWKTLLWELRQQHAKRKIPPVRALGRQVLDYLLPDRKFVPPVLLSPAFEVGSTIITERSWPDHHRKQIDLIRMRMRAHALRRGTTPKRVPFSLPFIDKRVLEFCLAAPGSMKVRDGYQRYLIRRALDGILPRRIQWRTEKRPFSPDYSIRYHAQLGKARNFVSAIGPNDPVRAVVDVDTLQYLLTSPDSRAGRAAMLSPVPTTIHLICFLRQFGEFRV
jgi:asparagine synthase (glutamine-hydrolysing)